MLDLWGWNPHWENFFVQLKNDRSLGVETTAEIQPGRVVRTDLNHFLLATHVGERAGEFLPHQLPQTPVPGDWVSWLPDAYDQGRAILHQIWPRRSQLSRKAAGKIGHEQVIAANMEHVFVVTSFNRDFNLNRLERYLTMVWQSGALPVILLSKSDLEGDLTAALDLVEETAPGVPVHPVSAIRRTGMEALATYLGPGQTVVVTGSSGVGKSTLINLLRGDGGQAVGPIRDQDGRGRHTTTAKALLQLPQGGVIIDTPGLRELSPWAGKAALDTTFADIGALAEGCRFRDCRHLGEPGCGVLRAVEGGELDPRRLENYHKMQREMAHLQLREDPRGKSLERARDKALHKIIRRTLAHKRSRNR